MLKPKAPAGSADEQLRRPNREIISMTARFWTCAIITTISALVSAGFSVAGLLGPSGSDIFERYASSRSIALTSLLFLRWAFSLRFSVPLSPASFLDRYGVMPTSMPAKREPPRAIILARWRRRPKKKPRPRSRGSFGHHAGSGSDPNPRKAYPTCGPRSAQPHGF